MVPYAQFSNLEQAIISHFRERTMAIIAHFKLSKIMLWNYSYGRSKMLYLTLGICILRTLKDFGGQEGKIWRGSIRLVSANSPWCFREIMAHSKFKILSIPSPSKLTVKLLNFLITRILGTELADFSVLKIQIPRMYNYTIIIVLAH